MSAESKTPPTSPKSHGLVEASRSVRLTMLGIAYFWLVTGLISPGLVRYCTGPVGLGGTQAELLVAAVGLSVLLGGWTATRTSPGRVELGLVPLGAMGSGLFSILLFWSPGWSHPVGWTVVWLVWLGLFAGLFVGPLFALVAFRTPRDRVGHMIGLTGCVTVLAALLGGLAGYLAQVMGLSPNLVFLVVGIITLGVTVYSCWLLPEFLLRFLFWLGTHTLYRVRVIGRENLPD